VNPCVVDQDNAWNRVRLGCNLIEKSNHIVACGRSLLCCPDQLAVMAQCPKHIDALSMRQWFD